MDWRDERGDFFLSALREGGKAPLELLNRSEIIRRVVAHDNGNAMLRRSAQLLLTLENDHFEGSKHLASTRVQGKTERRISKIYPPTCLSVLL